MFNRFTERARKVIILAKEEARRFNHDYIGTEHILLGLIREGEGVAAAVLEKLGLDLQTIRRGRKSSPARANHPDIRGYPLYPQGEKGPGAGG